jgi:hypothetical protein
VLIAALIGVNARLGTFTEAALHLHPLFQRQQTGGDLKCQAQKALPLLSRLFGLDGTTCDVQGSDDEAGVGNSGHLETKTHLVTANSR